MKNKTLALLSASLLCASASAGTYTWTGAAGDNLYFTAGNWSYDDGAGNVTSPAATAPARNTTDDIVISGAGAAVTYVPGSNFEPYGTVTISDGASFTQSGGTAGMKIHGPLVIDGGAFSNGTATASVQFDAAVTLRNGASLDLSKEPTGSGSIVVGAGCSLTSSANADWNTTARPKLVLDGGSVLLGIGREKHFMPYGNEELLSGTIETTGQFRPPEIYAVTTDVTFVSQRIAPQTSGSVVTFKSGRLVSTGTGSDGFYQTARSYIDVTTGSTAVFTFNVAAENVYAKTFGSNATNPKFRYEGGILSEAEFNALFTVEASADYPGLVDFYLTPAAGGAPSFVDNAVTAAVVSPTVATLSATVQDAGTPAAQIVALWGTTDGGRTFDGWDHELALGEAVAGSNFVATLALEPDRRYYYRLVATNEFGAAWATPNPASLVSVLVPSAPTNTWTGAVSSDSRDPDNWSLGHVPTAGETVFVLDLLAQNPLDWWPGTGTDEVAGWIQPAEFENAAWTVTFHTTPAAGLAVAGDVSLGAGIWTHEGPSATPTNAVNVSAGGDFALGAQAKIYAGNGATNDEAGRARGYYNAGPGYTAGLAGASFAGDGGATSVVAFVSYGSVLDPREPGSSGLGDNLGFSGAGVVLLDVAGALTVDGAIAAIGHGWNGATGKGASTGGSISIAAGSLAGSGSISADGGQDTAVGSGSGGRIAVRLRDAAADFSAAPSLSATGRGGTASGATASAAGTIYRQTAADGEGCGTVLVSNPANLATSSDASLPVAATHLPTTQPSGETLSRSNWRLERAGALRLTANARVRSLSTAAADGSQRVFTDGHTLTVKELTVAGTPYRTGRYTAADLPGLVVGDGAIVVDVMPIVIMVR